MDKMDSGTRHTFICSCNPGLMLQCSLLPKQEHTYINLAQVTGTESRVHMSFSVMLNTLILVMVMDGTAQNCSQVTLSVGLPSS